MSGKFSYLRTLCLAGEEINQNTFTSVVPWTNIFESGVNNFGRHVCSPVQRLGGLEVRHDHLISVFIVVLLRTVFGFVRGITHFFADLIFILDWTKNHVKFLPTNSVVRVVTGQLADTPTRGLPTRGLDDSRYWTSRGWVNLRTRQLMYWTNRGLDNSRIPPTTLRA